MSVNVLNGIEGVETRACNYAFKRYFNKKKYLSLKNDFLISAYVKIKERTNDYIFLNDDEQFSKCVSIATNEMVKFARSEIFNSSFSLNEKLSNNKNIDSKFTYEESKGHEDSFEFDYKLILNLYKKLYKSYDKNFQLIFSDYFIKGLSIQETYKKYNISKQKLTLIIREFREKFYQLLRKYDIDISLNKNDEFNHSNAVDLAYQRFKAKKQGVIVYNNNDYKVYSLLREMPFQEIADYLELDVVRYERILKHLAGGLKLYLWQIQKLRNKYFQNYTLEELVQVA